MLVFLLAFSFASAQTASFADNGVELFSDKRDATEFRAAVEPVLPALGECASETGGLDYGELTLSFMVGRKGKTENVSVRSPYVLPRNLVKCLQAPVEELSFSRGDVSVAKLVVTLPTSRPAPVNEVVEPSAEPSEAPAPEQTATGGVDEPATP